MLSRDRLNPLHSASTAQQPNAIELEGKVVAVLTGAMYRFHLANGHIVLGHISGNLRTHYAKIAAGDRVKMEVSPCDMDKARITCRLKDPSALRRPPFRRRYWGARSTAPGGHILRGVPGRIARSRPAEDYPKRTGAQRLTVIADPRER